MKFLPGDRFIACLSEPPIAPCLACGQVGYRVVVIRSKIGNVRRIPLCGRHFIDECILHPEIQALERNQAMEMTYRRAAQHPDLFCPQCGKKLELGDVGSAAGTFRTICKQCGSAITVEDGVPHLLRK